MTPDSNGHSDLDHETVAELRRLARSRPRSGREAVAKASALRTFQRLRRDPFYELDWEFLHEHPHILERHWERAWHEGRV
jgi:hypothetical protein